MTYPKPRYLGEGGEPSAHPSGRRPAAGPGVPVRHAGELPATGATTDGRFGLFRWDMGPEPGGPGPHFHRSFSESFYILSGSLRIDDGRAWREAQPGDFADVPEGGIHGFRNESGAPVSMLLHFAPGAPREGYFEGVTGLAGASEEERTAFFLRHDNHWV